MSEISDLMAIDPLKLTKEDRSVIIAKYRADRANFMLGVKAPREKKEKADTSGLSLGDLKLDL